MIHTYSLDVENCGIVIPTWYRNGSFTGIPTQELEDEEILHLLNTYELDRSKRDFDDAIAHRELINEAETRKLILIIDEQHLEGGNLK